MPDSQRNSGLGGRTSTGFAATSALPSKSPTTCSIWSATKSHGQEPGHRPRKQKPTLPVIRLLTESTQPERVEIIDLLTSDTATGRQQANYGSGRSDALQYTRDKAKWYANQAAQDLRQLPAKSDADTRHRRTELVVSRHD